MIDKNSHKNQKMYMYKTLSPKIDTSMMTSEILYLNQEITSTAGWFNW